MPVVQGRIEVADPGDAAVHGDDRTLRSRTKGWPQHGPGMNAASSLLRRPLSMGKYLSIRYTQRLADADADADAVTSVGSRGDAYDNALAESTIGLYKTELIGPRGPWRTADQVELATLAWVQWWNQRRLHGALDHIPPAEDEALYNRQLEQSKEVA